MDYNLQINADTVSVVLAIIAAIAMFVKSPGEAKRVHAAYVAGLDKCGELTEQATIGEPGDGNEHDERPVIGQARGPG